MATENTPVNENDDTPSNDQQQTPPSKQSYSEQNNHDFNQTFHSTPNIVTKDLRQHYPSQSLTTANAISQNNEKQCYVCTKKFGVRRMRRKHTCRRCNYKVCGNCSSKKRYDTKTDTMVRVCETCLQNEHCIIMTHRLRNLKLKHNKRNRGTYIVKVNQGTKEYGEGLVNKCRIVEINEQNVESLNAQLIADKLNTIKIPFSITLDYSEAEIKHDQLTNLKNRKKIAYKKDEKKRKHSKEDKERDMNKDIKMGTAHLINANQNPQNQFYYGPPQTYAPQPVIVTGPSADIRNMYKTNYSDSYNDSYYDHHTRVIYEKSPHKKVTRDDESDGLPISSDESEENNTYENDSPSELMQYDSDENSNSDVQNGEESDPTHMNGNSHAKTDEIESDKPPISLRAKSVPCTPVMNGSKSNPKISVPIPTTPTLNGNIGLATPFVDDATDISAMKSLTLDDDTKNENEKDMFSKTPKGDKSSSNVLPDTQITRVKRSMSQDNLDPTSPPLMAKNGEKKVKKTVKHKKKRRKKTKPELDEELTMKSNKKKAFFRRKSQHKIIENYTNLHNNIYSEINPANAKPVISSNINEYTTEKLNPPGYNPKRVIISPKRAKHGQSPPRYSAYAQQNIARQRLEMQQHIAQSKHVLVNPYRQFSIAFNKRPFNIKLQYRNGFNAFMSPSSAHIQQSTTLTRREYVWGWYSVCKHARIPIGSKLVSINFEWIYGMDQQRIAALMYETALPTTLIFEAPSFLTQIPPSVYIQLSDDITESEEVKVSDESFSSVEFLERHKSIIYWWLEEGGFVMCGLAFIAFLMLDMPWYAHLKLYLPILTALVVVIVMNIPPKQLFNLCWDVMHLLIFKMHRKRKGTGLKLFGRTLLYGNGTEICDTHPNVSISNDQSLLLPQPTHGSLAQMSSRRSIANMSNIAHEIDMNHSPKIHKKRKKRRKPSKIEEKKEEFSSHSDNDADTKDEIKTEEMKPNKKQHTFDPDWESNICFPGGSTKVWGGFAPCSAKTLKLRGGTYLTDKIKIASEESLLSLANMDIFTIHSHINHIAQTEVSWFHQNRASLPRNLFFIIFNLRLDSMSASVIQYFYIDKDKFKHLLSENAKVAKMGKEKGDGYFCIGGKGFDESGMFWNFINGPCQYRNDRLKLLARKEEGPWYMQIPSRPAIIGKQVPIEYFRGYDGTELNSLKMHNTRSHAYDTYDFQTLYHERDESKRVKGVPCECGTCRWIDTKGEYPDYIEVDITCEVNNVAKQTIRIACPLAKSLQVEMHWTMEGQINNVELPERMLASARLIHVDLTSLVEVD